MHAIPAQPRAWFLGSAPSTFTSRWRERLIHRVGGLLPVWRGGIGIDQHIESARAVIANGAVFAQMPEGTVSGPPGRIGQFRTGWAVIALRVDAPIVPLAMAGTEELYIGRRIASRVLPVTSARALAGLAPDAPLPEPGSREELDARPPDERGAGGASSARSSRSCIPWTVDPPGHRRRGRKRLTWLLLRPRPPRSGWLTAARPVGLIGDAERAGDHRRIASLLAIGGHHRRGRLRVQDRGSRAAVTCRATRPAGRSVAGSPPGLPHRTWVDPFVVASAAGRAAARLLR